MAYRRPADTACARRRTATREAPRVMSCREPDQILRPDVASSSQRPAMIRLCHAWSSPRKQPAPKTSFHGAISIDSRWVVRSSTTRSTVARDGRMSISFSRAVLRLATARLPLPGQLFREFRGPKLMVETIGDQHHAGFINVTELYHALARFWPPEQAASDRWRSEEHT